jgi:hypothetical protein
MFERWLKDAGQDVSSFSMENLPIGGTVPGIGELRVITSPYHDPPQLPWVVLVDNFLSDEESNRMIELGEAKGYKKSRVATEVRGVFAESKGRTSYNTFCDEKCAADPLIKPVIERMTNLTGIPYDNFEVCSLFTLFLCRSCRIINSPPTNPFS